MPNENEKGAALRERLARRVAGLAALALAASAALAAGACGEGGGGGEGGGQPPGPSRCATDADCNDLNACTKDACGEDGVCTATLVPNGEAPEQREGDCKRTRCVEGVPEDEVDTSDAPDDEQACTLDGCSDAGEPAFLESPEGFPCQEGQGTGKCEAGACVVPCDAASAAAQCDDLDPCTQDGCLPAGVCGHAVVSGDAPGLPQTYGDCRRSTCHAGEAAEVPDEEDHADDGDPCTRDFCEGTLPAHEPEPEGASCSVGGEAGACDGTGACVVPVECESDADCDLAVGTPCAQGACVGQACVVTVAPSGTPLPEAYQTEHDCATLVCGDGDNVYELADEADVPPDDAGSPCSKPACQGSYPTEVYEPQGTPCGQGGVCTGTGGSCCTKSSCAGSGYNCGVIDDGCGGTTECGQCAPGDTCGPSQARVCGCTDGVQNGAETGVDCGGPCPSCSLLGLGKPCEAGAQCGSGHCADGVCCSSACAGSCEACVSPKTGAPTGTCAPVSSGADPDGECAAQPASSCGTTGACNGQGACALHPAGTECAPGSCSGGAEIAPDTCDGKGACLDGGSAPCPTPYVCGASGACQSCSDGVKNGGEIATDCGGTCGGCPNGTPCGAAADCASGQCVDGVCCSSACTGTCRSCSAGSPGTCAFHPSGTDPENDCPGAKTCNGAGSCS